jgi:hypothetical protein
MYLVQVRRTKGWVEKEVLEEARLIDGRKSRAGQALNGCT